MAPKKKPAPRKVKPRTWPLLGSHKQLLGVIDSQYQQQRHALIQQIMGECMGEAAKNAEIKINFNGEAFVEVLGE